jgi:hypothetical protein
VCRTRQIAVDLDCCGVAKAGAEQKQEVFPAAPEAAVLEFLGERIAPTSGGMGTRLMP